MFTPPTDVDTDSPSPEPPGRTEKHARAASPGTARGARGDSCPGEGPPVQAGPAAHAASLGRRPRNAPDSSENSPTTPGTWPTQVSRSAAQHCPAWDGRHQLRPLTVHSGFTGLGSHSRVLSELGVHFTDLAGCDPKPESHEWLREQGLTPAHLFQDIAAMTAAVQCHTCQPGPCSMAPARPDLYVGGFCCQPYSQMRADRRRRPAQDHPLFQTTRDQVAYLAAWQPRVALLENTPGICHVGTYDGQELSGLQWLAQQLSQQYAVAHVILNLAAWVAISRPRVWIVCVHVDVGAERAMRMAREAAHMASAIESARSSSPPEPLSGYLFQPGTPDYTRAVGAAMAGTRPPAISGPRPRDLAGKEPAWKRQCRDAREACGAAAVHPLADRSLTGLSGTPRQREVLEVMFLRACSRHGYDLTDPAQAAAARGRFVADVSQNPRAGKEAVEICPCLSTGAEIYHYGLDRLITGEELLLAHGWLTQWARPRPTRCLSDPQLRDLAGECMALQCLATATVATLSATLAALPGVWR